MSLVTEIDYGTPASRSDKTVTLTIDGMEVHVPEGTSIMRAAMEVGTKIPKLCATDMIEAFGSCRLCLVEVAGRAGTPASCTTPVAPGMVVHTQTERLKALRKGVMELYISDHPLDCLTCAANGNCELQTEAGNVGLRDVRYGYAGANHLADKKDESNPYFSYDPAKCIVCNRCIRLRGSAGNLCSHNRRAWFWEPGFGGANGALPRVGVRILRRLRPGLPDRDTHREVGDRHRPG
jgi:formate dehydrogenase major subunit